MGSATTQTTIANRALQILGYKPIGSISDNDRGANAVRRAYSSVLLNVLRSNFWSFAIKRTSLAASATPPAFGKANYFPLPGDFIMVAPPDQINIYPSGAIPVGQPNTLLYNDYQIENGNNQACIASNQAGPIYIRYVSSQVSESMFDPSFSEALSAAIALEICEELTQSNTKLQNIETLYKEAIDTAKKRNAIENKPVQPPVDTWILARM